MSVAAGRREAVGPEKGPDDLKLILDALIGEICVGDWGHGAHTFQGKADVC